MTTQALPVRTNWDDAPLHTDLVWNGRVKNNRGSRGALVGTLLGLPVDGHSFGRAVAYQFGLLTGEVRTVWWDGTLTHGDVPELYDVDTGESVLRNPQAFAWFARLQDVTP